MIWNQNMNLEDLDPKLQERARACKTPEELVELARNEGVTLTEEQIERVSGGLDLISVAVK